MSTEPILTGGPSGTVEPELPPAQAEDDPVSRLAHELGERVKELNCLFGISDIVERAQGSLESIMSETVELLAESWDHADVACARIVIGEQEFRSALFGPTQVSQTADLMVHGNAIGTIEVSYREARPDRFEGPFSREERRLLNAVAQRLGHVVERLETEDFLRAKEEEFRQKMTHITRVNTMGEMASSIAHEVNQPLTAIATYAQACLRLVRAGTVDSPEVQSVLEKIGEEALRAGEIIRRLRTMVHPKPTKLVECDLTRLVREVETLAQVDARLNDVRMTCKIPRNLPTVRADGVQIQQVLLNLIRNGIDAMADTPRSRRVLEVRLALLEADAVHVMVADRGRGLPDVREDELFEPFFTTKEAGLGLGLSISRSIVSAHGGRLWFSSDPRGGTIFSFTLPVGGPESHD